LSPFRRTINSSYHNSGYSNYIVAIAATAELSTTVVLVIQPFRQRMAVPAASEIKEEENF
jgi:hypothetical protein